MNTHPNPDRQLLRLLHYRAIEAILLAEKNGGHWLRVHRNSLSPNRPTYRWVYWRK